MIAAFLALFAVGDSWIYDRSVSFSSTESTDIDRIQVKVLKVSPQVVISVSSVLKETLIGQDHVPAPAGTEPSVRRLIFKPDGSWLSGPLPEDAVLAAVERVQWALLSPSDVKNVTLTQESNKGQELAYKVSYIQSGENGFLLTGRATLLPEKRMVKEMTLTAKGVRIPGSDERSDETVHVTLQR